MVDSIRVHVLEQTADWKESRRPAWTPTVLLSVNALLPADSPRVNGVDEMHAQLLAECGSELPPIVVHRATMRVVDGMHRLRAAQISGRERIAAQFFDGSVEAAYLKAVTENIAHGLPLSLADRETAAQRIMRLYPDWSDGRVAKAAGLSPKTVGALRRRSPAAPPLEARVGRDGRQRPLDGAQGRLVASELVAKHPEASLRQIARAAGISPTTVRDVRDRMRRGEHPVTPTQRPGSERRLDQRRTGDRTRSNRAQSAARPTPAPDECGDYSTVMENLRRDPSLRYTDVGRSLLRWLDKHLTTTGDLVDLVAAMPPHCLPVVARLARQCAREWESLSQHLDQRAGDCT